MNYRVGIGHDLADGGLTTIQPQPRCLGVQQTRRSYAASGDVYEEAAWAELVFNVLNTEADYLTLLTYFGLDASLTSLVTVRLPSQFFTNTLYNATAVRPDHGREVGRDYFVKDVTILLRDLEQLVEA